MAAPVARVAVVNAGRSVLPVERRIYRIPALSAFPELLHGISTRLSPDDEDWNLSARRGTPEHPPHPERALANRDKLARALGVDLGRMVGCQQVHGSEVAVVGPQHAGRGMLPDTPTIQGADALVTATPGLYLLALSADCPPVFFYDPQKRVVGLAHSGWKGTVARISGKVIETMAGEFGTRPSDVRVAIGPGIGPCCYAVGSNVIEAAEASFPAAWEQAILQRRDSTVYFDLWAAIYRAVLDAGVPAENVTSQQMCTADNLDIFYSHRGEAGKCGLFGAVLGMREG